MKNKTISKNTLQDSLDIVEAMKSRFLYIMNGDTRSLRANNQIKRMLKKFKKHHPKFASLNNFELSFFLVQYIGMLDSTINNSKMDYVADMIGDDSIDGVFEMLRIIQQKKFGEMFDYAWNNYDNTYRISIIKVVELMNKFK